MRAPLLLFTAAILLTACAAPVHRFEGEHCVMEVHESYGKAYASHLFLLTETVTQNVEQRLGVEVETPFHVRVQKGDYIRKKGTLAFCFDEGDPRLLFCRISVWDPGVYVSMLAHELTHLAFRDQDLPYLIDEGIAGAMGLAYLPPHRKPAANASIASLESHAGRTDPFYLGTGLYPRPDIEFSRAMLRMTRAEGFSDEREDSFELAQAAHEFVRRVGLDEMLERIRESRMDELELLELAK